MSDKREQYDRFRRAVTAMDLLHDRIQQHREEQRSIEADRLAIQEYCPHPFAEYEPDPSGNNDSGHRCLTCEKWLGKNW